MQRLKTLDFYPKTIDDFKVKTLSGATISIISLIIIMVLFFSEFIYYLQIERHDELYVDVSTQKKMEIYLNITFPSMACDVVSIDMQDISGDSQFNIQNTVYKRRLDLQTGIPLDEYKLEKKIVVVPDKDMSKELIIAKMKAPGYCGGCYGAEQSKEQCCNTCVSVKEAYARKGWAFIENDDIEQCHEESVDRKTKYAKLEGCNLHGFFLVNKVAGNFHISPGKSTGQGDTHMHDYMPFELDHFNSSHIIHSLGFGEKYPGLHNPLDGVRKIVSDTGLFQYFIKVVPTIYEQDSSQLLTNQFSVTQHFRPHNNVHKSVVPGVYFMYDLSPIMVHITEKKKSFLHFLTNLCAVLGGVFAIAGIVDSVVYRYLDGRKAPMQ